MATLLHHLSLSLPLFVLVLLGYGLMAWAGWPPAVSEGLSRFVFGCALPALLFRLLSDFSHLPPVDARLLLAFFGGCLVVFAVGRVVGLLAFQLDGVAQSVFALGGVFSNNLLLGVPIARAALGERALPSVALVLVFNALILWTLVTVSVEWARHGRLSAAGFLATARSVVTNPVVAGILAGTAFGFSGLALPAFLDHPLGLLAEAASPLALVSLGMGLAEFGVRVGWRESLAICALKLVVLPLTVWALAWLLGLPPLETQVVVLLSALATGINVYLMSRRFAVMESAVAGSLLLSTALSALSVPAALALLGA